MSRAPVNFCQVCGAPMRDQEAFGRLRRVCSACGHIHFDDPKVAAVVFIEHDDRVLLVRRAMNPECGKWALPAGYIDADEDPRQAAIREVREETGLEITITRLLGVEGGPQSMGASIVICFAGRVQNGTAAPHDDVDAVCWYRADDPMPELAFASTQRLLTDWVARHTDKE